MGTTLDMAKRLKQHSLRAMAAEVAALSLTPVHHPISLREILTLFAKIAKPEPPKDLINEWIFPVTSPTLSPIFADLKWTDAGAKSFRYATRYRCRIAVGFGSGYAGLLDKDEWTTDTENVFQVPLNFDSDYKESVMAWNEWGQSEWAWIKTHTYSNPNPPPQPSPSPPPPPPRAPEPNAIKFWNCDTTGEDHLEVFFWLQDLTAGTGWQSAPVDSGYTSGGCGASYSGPQYTTSLVAGHQYLFAVVKPGGPNCDGSNDPNGDCWVMGNNREGDVPLKAGHDGALSIQYPP
jgi:hypothetical protein